MPLTREIYIEQDDFLEDAPKKFFRLKPEGEVRLRFAGIIKCDKVVKDAAGKVTELQCTFDPDHSRKVKGTIHWVSADKCVTAEVRLYDHLFKVETPDDAPDGGTFLDNLNPSSLEVVKDARLEPSHQVLGDDDAHLAGIELHRAADRERADALDELLHELGVEAGAALLVQVAQGT